ncbi:50S ribosomal protein L11 methyltransferase [bacterium]|nr:50S ribosomal protein L11 methyltransferase [bacterium]
MKIGRRFLLIPGETSPNKAPEEMGDRFPIRLSPGKAFGSGLHETTVSCLEALEGLGSLKNRSVLDVGTGTGILSLACLLLGARKVLAFDIDSDAARNCTRNAALNQVSEQLRVFQGTLEAVSPSVGFDLVLANIHGDIILKEADRLAGHTREEGFLILSGLDYTDNTQAKSAMKEQGMEEVSVLFLEDFVTQVWRRPPGRLRTGP